MIGISRKKLVEVPLARTLQAFSDDYYGDDEGGRLREFFKAVENLRKDINQDTHAFEYCLCVLEEYLVALDMLEHYFPFGERNNMVQIETTWFNHLSKKKSSGGWLSKSDKTDSASMSSIHFERACTVFNIGAAYALEGVKNEDNKISIQRLQKAAAIFDLIRCQLMENIPAVVTCDLTENGLNMCSSICLGYAQRRFFTSAKSDNLPNGLLAKLANQVGEFFEAASQNTRKMEGAISPVYHSALVSVASLYRARALYHQAAMEKEKCEASMSGFGACVSRFQEAQRAANRAKELILADTSFQDSEEKFDVETLCAEILIGLNAVVNDNDNVYMEPVPKPAELPLIGKVATVKLQADVTLKSLYEQEREMCKYQQVMEHLVPEEVQEFVQDFYIRVESLVVALDSGQSWWLKEVEETMHKFNLPYCLDESQDSTMPDDLWATIVDVQSRGGIGALNAQLAKIQELEQAANQAVMSMEHQLVEEKLDDDRMREKFKMQWNRKESHKLTGQLFGSLRQTSVQLQSVREGAPALHSHISGIVDSYGSTLDRTRREIEDSLPTPVVIAQDSKLITSLRENFDKLLAETSNAAQISSQCRARILEFSIEGYLLDAHSKSIDMEAVINDAIDDLDGHRAESATALERLNSYILSLTDAFEKYQAAQGVQSNPRVTALSELKHKAETVLQSLSELTERVNFFDRMNGYINNLRTQVEGFVTTRGEEKMNLLAMMTRQMANPGAFFDGVVNEEFGLSPLGIKIGYEEGKGWRVNEVKADGEVAMSSTTLLSPGALIVSIDGYDIRNEPEVTRVLANPRGMTRRVTFAPACASSGAAPSADVLPVPTAPTFNMPPELPSTGGSLYPS